MRTPLFYGLMTGLAIAAWMLIEYLAGFHESEVGKFSGFAALVLAALGVYLSIKSYRRLQGGYMRYGRGVYIGFLTSIYAGIVVAAFTYLYYEFINPDFPEIMVEQVRQQMTAGGASDAAIDKQMALTRENYQAIPQSLNGFGGFVMIGLLFALLASAFLKRKPPVVQP